MRVSFDVLLVLGIVGFYLYDSAILLFPNEFVIAERLGKWSCSCPVGRWRLTGKIPYLCNPFTPFNPLFRAAWPHSASPSDSEAASRTERLAKSLSVFRLMIAALTAVLLVAIPVVIFRVGTGAWFYGALVTIYLTIVLMLIVAFRKRFDLGLSVKQLSMFAFEFLACPPFAVNFVRKISLSHVIPSDPVEFSRLRADKDGFNRLVQTLQVRVAEELEYEDDGSPRSSALIAFRDRLAAISS